MKLGAMIDRDGDRHAAPHQLAPADWKSSNDVWIVDIIAPFGGAQDVLKDLRENVFPSLTLHQLAPMPDGRRK